mgnify:CR=1 FL=1
MKKDSFNANEIPADKGLSGNEKIEEAIAALQEEPSQELLAHTLTAVSYTHLTLPTKRIV